jgi:hypothetical protein
MRQRIRLEVLVFALVGLGALVAVNAGVGANSAEAELVRIERLAERVPVTRFNMRSVEEPMSSSRASHRALGCLLRKVPEVTTLGGYDLRELTSELLQGCFAPDGSAEQERETNALPFAYAIDEATGIPVELEYHCSDVCPRFGAVRAHLTGVGEEDCCALGGTPDVDDGWRLFIGCVPAELSTPELRLKRCSQ